MQHFHTAVGLIAAMAAAFAATPARAQAAAPAATSNVVVYGLIDAVVRRASNVTAAGDAIWSMEDGIFTGSRLGFRGTEDLGGGLRAVFTLESGFDPSTGGSLQGTATADYGQEAINPRFWGREVHVGLRGNWGGVTLGRQYTTAHQIAARFQPQGNPNNVALSVFSSHHIARQDNMLRLDTKFGDVELQASRTFGEQAASSSTNASWAIGAGYTKDALSLGAYVQQMENRAGTEKRKIVGLGGNYKLNPMFTLFGGYMQRSAEVSPQENKVWALGANVELSPAVTLSLEVFDDKQTGSAALEGARKVGWVTANYRFSRRTDVYAVVDHNKVEGGYAKPAFMGTLGSQTALSLGLRHRF
jgi:predicted porin